ncbi:MAG: hypothetical protein WBD07_06445 [Vicinamibacterales bacterium]
MAEVDVTVRLAKLETAVAELRAVQDVLLRLLSSERPLARVLERYGATETKEKELFDLLDEMVGRLRGPEPDRPTFGYLQMRLASIFHDIGRDPEFVQLLVDTLKIDRPAYRALHDYAVEQRWLA